MSFSSNMEASNASRSRSWRIDRIPAGSVSSEAGLNSGLKYCVVWKEDWSSDSLLNARRCFFEISSKLNALKREGVAITTGIFRGKLGGISRLRLEMAASWGCASVSNLRVKEGEGRGGEAFAGGGVRADSIDQSQSTQLKSIRIVSIRYRECLFARFQNGFACAVC